MRSLSKLLSAVACSLFMAAPVMAETYYVDFAGGDNKADGRSPQTAWKHAPGDPAATDNPSAVKLVGGDTVILKGGVVYHGSISIKASGSPGKPIVYDGNTAGNFGNGRAILDGGRVITNWKRAASADEAMGNPNWSKIYYADIDVDLTPNFTTGQFVSHRQVPRDKQAPWQRIILCDGDRRLLPISQFPKPADPFYPDLPGGFLSSSKKVDVSGNQTIITDTADKLSSDAGAYEGAFVGLHGGNNHVYFAAVEKYDPAAKQIYAAKFTERTYDTTKYALFNSVRLITEPGEWAITALEGGKSRIYLMPDRLENDQPVNIGYPEHLTGISVDDGASHIQIRGLVIQRFSGGGGAVSIARARGNARANNVLISDCEVRFVAGHAGIGLNYCDRIVVEKNYIHHCPAWTSGIFLSRVRNYEVRNNFLDKNSGTGIRHYESKDGVLSGNVVLDHFGMHSSGMNAYEGCANLVFEGNYVENTITINRNADNLVFRNNVIDGKGHAAVTLALWTSGQVGGREINNIQFINNTFVNVTRDTNWSCGLFGQTGRNAKVPEGIVMRNNIIDRVHGQVKGTFENNIYLRKSADYSMGNGCQVVEDMNSLFVDPANGDFRRRPGSPSPDIGANVPPPPKKPEGF